MRHKYHSMIQKFRFIKRAENRSNEIRLNPDANEFIHPDGTTRTHAFDVLVIEHMGTPCLYTVRPKADVDKELLIAVKCIDEQSTDFYMSYYLVVTESFVTEARFLNALEILAARRARNSYDVEIALHHVRETTDPGTFGELVDSLKMGSRGRNAILCLIDDEELEFKDGKRLGLDTRLEHTG